MTCTSPVKMKLFDIEVPCRKCQACRIAYSAEWAMRLQHEAHYWDKKSFVTLTYADEYLPPGGVLIKADLQKAIKRLRFATEAKVKYFAVGDYGDLMGRPHFHMILFGMDDTDHKISATIKYLAEKGPLVEAWGMGNVYIGTVTSASCRYVTDYIFKVFNGEKAKEAYGEKPPPFKLLSKGIGKKWVDENQDYLKDNLTKVTVEGKPHPIPRYYLDKMKIDKEDLSKLRAIFRHEAKERKYKRLAEFGIEGEKLKDYLISSRYQRDIELSQLAERKRKRRALRSL